MNYGVERMSLQNKLYYLSNTIRHFINTYIVSFFRRQKKVKVIREYLSTPPVVLPGNKEDKPIIRPTPQVVLPGNKQDNPVIRPTSQVVLPGNKQDNPVIRPTSQVVLPGNKQDNPVIRPTSQVVLPGNKQDNPVIRPAPQVVLPGNKEDKPVIRPAPQVVLPGNKEDKPVIRPTPQVVLPGNKEDKPVIRPAPQVVLPGNKEDKPVIRPASQIIKPAALIDATVEMIDLGWEKRGSNFFGFFSDDDNKYEGRIEWNSEFYDTYIRYPPKDVLVGPHSACFHERPDGWYWIHLNNPRSDPVETFRTVDYLIRNPLLPH